MMKKVFLKVVVPIVAVLFLAACSEGESRSVAKVGSENIKEEELNTVLQKQYGSSMLDTLISYKIVDLEAKEKGLEVSDEEIDAEYETYADQYGGTDGLTEMLKEYNMSEKDIREDIRIYLLTLKLLEGEVDITEQEMKDYYKENKDYFSVAEKITASRILVEDEKLAKEIIKRIADGEDFDALAKQYSIEEHADHEGATVTTFGRGEMEEAFEKAAFAMEVGEVSQEPVKSELGYYIIMVQDKEAGKESNYEDSKEEVHKMLLEEKVDEAYQPWLETKYEEYDVKKTLFE